jgi:hypothetical protein
MRIDDGSMELILKNEVAIRDVNDNLLADCYITVWKCSGSMFNRGVSIRQTEEGNAI